MPLRQLFFQNPGGLLSAEKQFFRRIGSFYYFSTVEYYSQQVSVGGVQTVKSGDFRIVAGEKNVTGERIDQFAE